MRENVNLENLDIAFERALLDLDFGKIKSIMDMLDWKWANINRVPETNEMAKTIRELYSYCRKDIRESDTLETLTSTGGFEVRVFSEGVVEIYFIADMAMGYCDGKD